MCVASRIEPPQLPVLPSASLSSSTKACQGNCEIEDSCPPTMYGTSAPPCCDAAPAEDATARQSAHALSAAIARIAAAERRIEARLIVERIFSKDVRSIGPVHRMFALL